MDPASDLGHCGAAVQTIEISRDIDLWPAESASFLWRLLHGVVKAAAPTNYVVYSVMSVVKEKD